MLLKRDASNYGTDVSDLEVVYSLQQLSIYCASAIVALLIYDTSWALLYLPKSLLIDSSIQ